MNGRKYSHAIDYIYWKREATSKKCTFNEFNEIKDRLEKDGKKIEYSTKRENYDNLCYSIVNSRKYNSKNIYLYENGKYYVFYTNKIDDNKNKRPEAIGKFAIQTVNAKFLADNKITLKKAFGYVDEEFKRCVPKIFSWSDPHSYDKIIVSSSVDFSSHWPYNAQGKLPDAHNMVKYEGTVKPTEEYPFAFYLKSGHVAEYNRFDSHDWVKLRLEAAMFRHTKHEDEFPQNQYLPPEEDITVLMKSSDYELGKYYEEFYNLRKTNKNAKLYANASLGYMHTKSYKNFRLSHIVAIVLGRAQAKTIEAMEKIGEQYVIHAVVDGFVYRGSYQIGEDEKYFGNLHQEWVGKPIKIHKTNCYIVMDNDKCIKVKHGSYECYKDGSDITEDTVKDFNDFENWKTKRSVE